MEECNEKIITKQTAVSVGLIMTAVGIIGSVIWMFATLTANVSSNTERINRLEMLMEKVATKEDLNKLESNITNYLIKKYD